MAYVWHWDWTSAFHSRACPSHQGAQAPASIHQLKQQTGKMGESQLSPFPAFKAAPFWLGWDWEEILFTSQVSLCFRNYIRTPTSIRNRRVQFKHLFSVLFNIFFSYVRVRIIKASAYITADNAYEHVSVVPGMKWKTWEVQSQQTGLQWKHNLLFKLTNKKLWKTTKKEALKRRINGSMTNVYVCWSFFWSHQLGDSSSILWDTSSALEL